MGWPDTSRRWGQHPEIQLGNPPVCIEILGGNDARVEALVLSGLEILLVAFPASGGSGGDIYCLHSCSDRTLVKMALVDVTGHGQRSASVARDIHALFHQHESETSPGRLLSVVNRRFSQLAPPGVLATSLCAAYDSRLGELHYAYGGQPRILSWQARQRQWLTLEPSRDSDCGLPFGVSASGCYEEETRSLDPGDIVLMFSDGVSETRNPSGALLQRHGVLRLAEECTNAMRAGLFPLPALAQGFLSRLQEFRGSPSFEDDITLLWVRRLPGTAAATPRFGKGIPQKEKL
ncbi:MAG: serine/threonine-protein phosphatase [Acidobacteria bacterium]|nr:serine/threonine-protein phosphatase [Acidobacteriota bacterium]